MNSKNISLSKLYSKICNEIDSFFSYSILRLLDCLGWGSFANRLRAFILRKSGFKIGKGVILRPGVIIHNRSIPVFIGDHTSINKNVLFDADAPIAIGNYCNIGFNTVFTNSVHELRSNFKTLRPNKKGLPIKIEDFVWIGCNATILGGVTIGKGSVVGAGSVVTKDIPENVFVAGIPAKIIRKLDEE